VELIIKGMPSSSRFPLFLTNDDSLHPFEIEGEIALTIEDLWSAADMQANIAFSKWVTRNWQRPGAFEDELVAVAKATRPDSGTRLPFELRSERNLIHGVVLLKEHLGINRFRALFSLSDIPERSIAGRILARTSKWLEGEEEREITLEIGSVLTLY